MRQREKQGKEEDDGGTRRRWLLRRNQWRYSAHYSNAQLAVPLIEAFGVATGPATSNGGARPWHGRLRRRYGVKVPNGDPTGSGGTPMT